MEPVPGWARGLGVALAAVTTPVLVLLVAAGSIAAAVTDASMDRTVSYAVGDSPLVRIDAQFADLVIEAGQPGHVAVEDRHDAGSITRAAAAAAAATTRLNVVRHGAGLDVRESSPLLPWPAINHSATLTVRVPPRTNMDVTGVGNVDLEGIQMTGSVATQFGQVRLHDVGLYGTSSLRIPAGNVQMQHVTVSGNASVRTVVGTVDFDGSLARGGTTLTITGQAGNVSLTLPYPTDARATLSTQAGALQADPAWGFVRDSAASPQRWSANLGPNPTGRVTVTTQAGNVSVAVR